MTDSALGAAMQCFAVDRVTAEVAAAFEEAGIPFMLVKGPTIATWLYGEDASRPYADTDLLLPREHWDRAMGLMPGLGFADSLGHLEHPRMESGSGYPWSRPSADPEVEEGVDLHFNLFGLGAPPEEVWTTLRETSEELRVGGATVRMPGRPARLLHITLHAVQHGGEAEGRPMVTLQRRPMIDLERAIRLVPISTWEEARELARRLDALPGFAAGLSLVAEGRELAVDLGVESEVSAETTMRLEGVPMSEGFAELAAARGPRAKLAMIVRELFPNPSFMRWWSPLARRGRLGLALAYLGRPFWLAWHAPGGLRAWRRARAAD